MRKNERHDVFRYITIPVDDNGEADKKQCWIWHGSFGGRGRERPYFSVNGTKHLSHRLVYTLVIGDIPEGYQLRHSCDNSSCCNPYHLTPGTASENQQDVMMRDRKGLPVAAVREIRRLLETSGWSHRSIAGWVAVKFGIECSRQTVTAINNDARRAGQEGAQTTDEVLAERLASGMIKMPSIVEE